MNVKYRKIVEFQEQIVKAFFFNEYRVDVHVTLEIVD